MAFRGYADVRLMTSLCALALAATGCDRAQESSTSIADVYDLVDGIAKTSKEVHVKNDEVFKRLKLEEFRYQGLEERAGAFVVRPMCGVRYVLGDKAWGVVPESDYKCDDKEAAKAALTAAAPRLRGLTGVALDENEAVLAGQVWPRAKMEATGPAVVTARALKSPFELEPCLKATAERVAKSEAAIATLQCTMFADPGARLDRFRAELAKARAIAGEKLAVPPTRVVKGGTEPQVAACEGEAAKSEFSAPGTSRSTAGGKPVVFRVFAGPNETFKVTLSSTDFDPLLEIREADGKRILARDDDAGEGNNSLLTFTPPTEAEFVVVVRASGGAPMGRFELGFERPVDAQLSAEDREGLEKFVEWFDKAKPEAFAATWQARAGAPLQLACLNQARLADQGVVQQAASTAALSLCERGLDAASEALRDKRREKEQEKESAEAIKPPEGSKK